MVLAIPIALRITTDTTRRDAVAAGRARRVLPAVRLPLHDVLARRDPRVPRRRSSSSPRSAASACAAWRSSAVTIVVSIPASGWRSTGPALKGINVPLDERVPDGIVLGLVMAGCLIALLIAGWGMLQLEQRTPWNEERTQLVWRGLAALAAILVIFTLGAILSAPDGPGGWADRAWEKFSQTSRDEVVRSVAAGLLELRQPLGVVEGGRGRVVGQAAARLGRRLVPGDAQDVPRGRARRDAAAQHAAAVPRRDGDRRRAARARARSASCCSAPWTGCARWPTGASATSAWRCSPARSRGSCTASSTGTGTSPASRCPCCCSSACSSPRRASSAPAGAGAARARTARAASRWRSPACAPAS